MDLSWPKGAAVNVGIDHEQYIDGPANITLPTVDYMADWLLQLGPGAYLYKTDMAQGYRLLWVARPTGCGSVFVRRDFSTWISSHCSG